MEALNRSLQDIFRNKARMGGVVVLLAGDFRQILPFGERVTPADEINACIKASPLWTRVEKFYLTCNISVQLYNDWESGGPNASKLLKIGSLTYVWEWKISSTSDFCKTVTSSSEPISQIFPNFQNKMTPKECSSFTEMWFCQSNQ